MHFLSHSVSAVLCFDDRLVEKVRETVNMPIRAQNDVAAATAVSAIGSTFRHKFLPPKAHRPAPATARLHKNFDPTDNHSSFPVKHLSFHSAEYFLLLKR